MKKETFKWLGMGISLVGLIIIVLNAVDYISGARKLPESIIIIGLLMAVVGMWMNNRVLFGKKR